MVDASLEPWRTVQPGDPPWLVWAFGELGTHETPGPAATARIVYYHAATTLNAQSDEVPWCSAFVNRAMKDAGRVGTKSAAARSWLSWGRPLTQPVRGAVIVLARGQGWQGHVGFYLRRDLEHVSVLGGNQGDAVTIARYPWSRVLSVRWPIDGAAGVVA